MKYLVVIASLIMFSVTSIAGHHEGGDDIHSHRDHRDLD